MFVPFCTVKGRVTTARHRETHHHRQHLPPPSPPPPPAMYTPSPRTRRSSLSLSLLVSTRVPTSEILLEQEAIVWPPGVVFAILLWPGVWPGSRMSVFLVERTHSGLDCTKPTSDLATYFRSIAKEYAGPLEPGGSWADWQCAKNVPGYGHRAV
ncbi:hypothetical protein Vadar_019007 [Vaccinium darrowii]|uniref:Uncharacterized protein n=1 Tax=Vaccinium darrowii TaxID=229202 RepID=A0ACB7YX02_9ERIC|nr:hypothetical protein Vadar_019007 [Vaccinium darrowii]